MKITNEELWQSLNRIYSTQSRIKDMRNIGYSLPEALKDCAVIMVRDDLYSENPFDNPYLMLDEQNVIDGLKELKHNGYLTFSQG